MKYQARMNGLLGVFVIIACIPSVIYAGGKEVGNGGDFVEPLFIKAQKDAASIIHSIAPKDVDGLEIDEKFKTWLKVGERLSKIQYYVDKIELTFQETPCQEGQQPRGTCFDDSDSAHPKMVVSRSYNRATTPDQAIALVFHEAGHFTGETDHIFLSKLGVELVALASATPRNFKGEAFGQSGWVYQSFFDLNRQFYVDAACELAEKMAVSNALNACYEAGKSKCVVVSSGPSYTDYDINDAPKSDPSLPSKSARCWAIAIVRGR